jgi:hypothetical protein
MADQRKARRGFSLVLSLTVMAMLVLVIIVLASFISVEARLSSHSQQKLHAKLNAIVSLKLALGHLQQEAGPDQRSTARADITQPGVLPSALKNPMWTGIWRTDFPDMPPAWLVSGRHDVPAGSQSVTLGPAAELLSSYQRFSSSRLTGDYPLSIWVPWQADYTPPADRTVPLVGAGSTTGPESGLTSASSLSIAKPSGLVTLARIDLPGASIGGDAPGNITGSYAYWIGDEGIKARINLADKRNQTAPTADQLISLRSPSAAAFDLLPGLGTLAKPTDLGLIDKASNLSLTSGFTATTGLFTNCDKRLFHDISFISAGVLADSANGGLKRDLSVAFELSDNQFAASEFGSGIDGSSGKLAAASHNLAGFESNPAPVMKIGTSGLNYKAAPIFNRSNFQGTLLSPQVVRGPTWWALRDYHRLYKQLGWGSSSNVAPRSLGSAPTLLARSYYPNVGASHPEGTPTIPSITDPITGVTYPDTSHLRDSLYTYSDIFNGSQTATLNPNAADFMGGDTTKPIPRPLNCAVTPYVSRVQLVASVNKTVTVTLSDPIRTWNGKRWVWVQYTTTTVSLELNLTPVVSIHNPYNVALQFRSMKASNDESVAISFSDMSKWNFVVRNYADPTHPQSIPMSQFFNMQQASTSTAADMFKLFLPKDVVIGPGETRVFSCPPGTQSWNQAVKLSNSYSTTGGFFDHADQWGFGAANVFDFTHAIGMQINPASGNFRMRHALTCWPNDIIKDSGSTADFFFNSSEQSELVHSNINANAYTNLKPGTNGYPVGERFFLTYDAIHDKYDAFGNPNEPSIITVIEIAAKTADANVADTRSTPYPSPFPTLTHSNPWAASSRPDGAGRDPVTNAIINGPVPSYELKITTPDSWDNLIELVPSADMTKTNGYAGYSHGSDGSDKVILSEVPLVQPTSLAQYAHANLETRDQQPLLSIGNSFASTLVPTENAWCHNSGANWTEYDQTYLLNAALWDGFFLSSIGPQMATSSTSPLAPRLSNLTGFTQYYADTSAALDTLYVEDPNLNGDTPHTVKKKADVIKDYVAGIAPLDNPRLTLTPTLTGEDPNLILGDYRRTASTLLNLGAFNVNSTSVEAWETFLGSTRKLAAFNGSSPVATNAPFPRTQNTAAGSAASGNMTSASNWNGFSNLTDVQIAALAQAIVDENKLRFTSLVRTEWDQSAANKPLDPSGVVKATPPTSRLFRGLSTASTPYLGLSEFINRFLCSTPQIARCGTLQSAIFRADQNANTGLSDRLISGIGTSAFLTQASISSLTSSWSYKPQNVEMVSQNGTSRTFAALGAPGNLLQSDLLQSLGPALATRSDTFKIRCYGDATTLTGSTAKTWIEATVQRTPEFIDATNAPETGVSAPRPLVISWDALASGVPAALSPKISPLNHALGRRFKIISVRWLNQDEI